MTVHLETLSIKYSVLRALVSSFLFCFVHSSPYKHYFSLVYRQRPYHVENTGSRPITEVKQRRARLVLGWVTAWEHRVLLATFFFFFLTDSTLNLPLFVHLFLPAEALVNSVF